MNPDLMHLKQKESERFVLLVYLEGRKALYSALKYSLRSLESELETLLSSSGQQCFRYILYPVSGITRTGFGIPSAGGYSFPRQAISL